MAHRSHSLSPVGGVIQASFSGGPDGVRRLPFPGAVRAAAGVTAVPVPVERLRVGAPGGGRPLPATVQSRMEDLFGADFSGVRVHVDERPAAIGALAFAQGSNLHFAPGRYDPVSPAGQRLIAHELAHVVQQRAGRARNPFGSGTALVHDPALEAEAERMALRASEAAAAPRGSGTRPATGSQVAQPYFKIGFRQVHTKRSEISGWQTQALVSAEPGFHAQEEGREEYLKKRKARIVSLDKVPLRVSDDCRMAIEDTDLTHRQPKVFFATPEVARASNAALSETGSKFRLAQTGKTVRVITAWGTEYALRATYPVDAASDQEPDFRSFTANENCNDLTTSAIGTRSTDLAEILTVPAGTPSGIRTISNQVQVSIADLVVRVLRKARTGIVYHTRQVVTNEEWKEDSVAAARKMREAINQIGKAYSEVLSSGDADAVLRRMGINRHAAPGVGDAFVIHSVASEDSDGRIKDWESGRTFEPRWPYHFAGVVARSGTDVITLENYARRNRPFPSADPRWYFQMYGRKEGQSFHEAWKGANAFANPVTLALRNPKRRVPERRSTLNPRAVLLVLVIAVLIALGLLVYR